MRPAKQTPTVIVMAKVPVPGLVKTRLCPPLTPREAADLAAAALQDTMTTVRGCPGVQPVLALAGDPADLGQIQIRGFHVITQRGRSFGERLHHAFVDAQEFGHGHVLLVGMDTPQASIAQIVTSVEQLAEHDAVVGHAADGGWWLLGLSDARHAQVLADVPMSTDVTGIMTEQALRERGLSIAIGEPLRDVDTIDDAIAVARVVPNSLFARALAAQNIVAAR